MSTMEQATTPYKSRADFLTHGINEILLDTALDCSICREPLEVALGPAQSPPSQHPLAPVTSLAHITATSDSHSVGNISSGTQTLDASSSMTLLDAVPIPEPAVQILPCAHIFGLTCLRSWFAITGPTTTRCPECNIELFSDRYIKLFMRHASRESRIMFAEYVEEKLGNAEMAREIRVRLMSDWVEELIREFACALWRREGWEVEWEYLPRVAADDAEQGEGEGEQGARDELEDEGQEVNGEEEDANKEVDEEVDEEMDEEVEEEVDNLSDNEVEDYPSDEGDEMVDAFEGGY